MKKGVKAFKILFFVLVSLLALSILGGFTFMLIAVANDGGITVGLIISMIFLILFIAVIIAAVTIFVYKDASKRNLDPWMWMTIALFLPNLIGLIIYLILRNNNENKKCPQCNNTIKSDFKICPYCEYKLQSVCSKCRKNVSSEWKKCPYCGESLK